MNDTAELRRLLEQATARHPDIPSIATILESVPALLDRLEALEEVAEAAEVSHAQAACHADCWPERDRPRYLNEGLFRSGCGHETAALNLRAALDRVTEEAASE